MLAIFLIFKKLKDLESDEIYFRFFFTPGIQGFVFSHIKHTYKILWRDILDIELKNTLPVIIQGFSSWYLISWNNVW